MGLLVSLLLFPIIHPSRTHKLVFVGLRILVLPLIIVFYAVLVRNFYTSDPATACSWCRYLSCWPTAANNVSGRQRWLYILGDPPGRFRLPGGILMHWRRPLAALQGHRALDVLDFVVGNPVALYGPRVDVRLAAPLSGACCLYATSPSSTCTEVHHLFQRSLSLFMLLTFVHSLVFCHIYCSFSSSLPLSLSGRPCCALSCYPPACLYHCLHISTRSSKRRYR